MQPLFLFKCSPSLCKPCERATTYPAGVGSCDHCGQVKTSLMQLCFLWPEGTSSARHSLPPWIPAGCVAVPFTWSVPACWASRETSLHLVIAKWLKATPRTWSQTPWSTDQAGCSKCRNWELSWLNVWACTEGKKKNRTKDYVIESFVPQTPWLIFVEGP